MTQAYLLDWLNLLLRWAHAITAIAWIGASFHFVMLDNRLTRPEHDDLKAKGVDGELWAVHGGGFYHSNKYMVAPTWRPLPDNLHWSIWESYSTWLTGFALFTVLYLFQADSYLIDPRVHAWSAGPAVAAALGFLAVFWLAYDGVCRTLGRGRNGDRTVGLVVAALVVGASWLACQLFAGRAAFVLVGAMLATAMSANVFLRIIPGQRTVVAQLRAGQPPDPALGRRGKQRSVHNTYFTLPVIVAMLSNHYGWLVQGRHNWAVLVALMLAGALIRHSFVARHRAQTEGRRTPWGPAIAGTGVLLGLAVALVPRPVAQPAPGASAAPAGTVATAAATDAVATPSLAQVQAIVAQRCLPCHNATLAQKNVALHTPDLLQQHAQALRQQAVLLKTMPLNNATGITEDERGLLGRWVAAGAPLR